MPAARGAPARTPAAHRADAPPTMTPAVGAWSAAAIASRGRRAGPGAGGAGRVGADAGGVLPGGGEPVRAQGGRQRPAGAEAEVARAGAGDGGGRADLVELAQHLSGVGGRVGQRRVES